ncbi:hypothetical protein SAV31267_007300 [Streptomyces avermitilis]|uniref:Uncharacterized protein n=1 Tax=Streptomyces avermitilis TaxID=33903 RepID=A0A4D4MHR7_STRAX|nr:hypothetical protein SAV31267_007300 [Streptomyces avermitilis]
MRGAGGLVDESVAPVPAPGPQRIAAGRPLLRGMSLRCAPGGSTACHAGDPTASHNSSPSGPDSTTRTGVQVLR